MPNTKIESPFAGNAATRPLTAEESDAQAKLNALMARRYEVEHKLGKASVTAAEAQLEITRCQLVLHEIGHTVSNLRVGQPNG